MPSLTVALATLGVAELDIWSCTLLSNVRSLSLYGWTAFDWRPIPRGLLTPKLTLCETVLLLPALVPMMRTVPAQHVSSSSRTTPLQEWQLSGLQLIGLFTAPLLVAIKQPVLS